MNDHFYAHMFHADFMKFFVPGTNMNARQLKKLGTWSTETENRANHEPYSKMVCLFLTVNIQCFITALLIHSVHIF